MKAWNRTKIIAERPEAWQLQECEAQTLVLDFTSNTVTLTSTLDKASGNCVEWFDSMEKLTKKSLQDAAVFKLVHEYATPYVEESTKQLNPFFKF